MTALEAKESTTKTIIVNEIKRIEDMIQKAINKGIYLIKWYNTKLIYDWLSNDLYNNDTIQVIKYFSSKGYKITSKEWYNDIQFTISWS